MAFRLPKKPEVLELLGREGGPLHAQELAKKLGVQPGAQGAFMRMLDDMMFEGALVERPGQRFALRSNERERPADRKPHPISKGGSKAGAHSGSLGGANASLPRTDSRGPNERRGDDFRRDAKSRFGGRDGTAPPKREAFRDDRPADATTGRKGFPAGPLSRDASAGPRGARGLVGPRGSHGEDKAMPAFRVEGDAPGTVREGILSVNARGFGFVSSEGSKGDDVFIGADSLSGAMHGDRVEVRVRSRGQRGLDGEIVHIVARGRPRVSGILRRKGKSAWLEPDDTRIRGPIVLTLERDSVASEGNSGTDGDLAVVRITRYPELPGENPEGVLEAVLGRPGELQAEAKKLVLVSGIKELHTGEAVAEAESYGDEVPAAMLEGREDLTHIPLPTIDPEDARDHDDAVWVERTDDGGYLATIAIADVSSYVRLGTNLDTEAKERACSVYLPDRAIPMLPRALSSNLCSLLPNVVRLCLAVQAKLDAGGKVLETRMIRGMMKSQAKLTYGGVARALGLSEIPPIDPAAEGMRAGLETALELSRLLRAQRMKRGALDFELAEPKIILDAEGVPVDVKRRSDDPGVKKAYQLIEELMLLANELVAAWLTKREIPTIFRVHAAPDATKLDRLASFCETLGLEFDLAETADAKRLGGLLARFSKHELAPVLNNLLLRSMKQATYDTTNIGHFGLASQAYLHFTSPIRRYPDLVVHRAVHKEVLKERADRSPESREKLAEAALTASTAERRAMDLEREVADLYRAFLMKDRVGERFKGMVTAIVASGIFVALDDPFVDVLIKTDDLGHGFVIDDDGLRASGSGETIQLGDRIEIEVVEVNFSRRIVFARRTSGKIQRPRAPKLREVVQTGRGGRPDDRKKKGGRSKGKRLGGDNSNKKKGPFGGAQDRDPKKPGSFVAPHDRKTASGKNKKRKKR